MQNAITAVGGARPMDRDIGSGRVRHYGESEKRSSIRRNGAGEKFMQVNEVVAVVIRGCVGG